MLQNAYFLANIGADTAENEQHFAEICQKLAPPEQKAVHWAAGEGEVREVPRAVLLTQGGWLGARSGMQSPAAQDAGLGSD